MIIVSIFLPIKITLYYTLVLPVIVWEHKNGTHPGFTKKYGCNKLVYYEEYQWIQDAIAREKQLKDGTRQKKVDLINLENAGWMDLSEGWYDS
jgi:putative endonuclease